MSPLSTPQAIHQLRNIPLPSVLRLCQAQPDRHDPAKWHTADGVLSIQGSQFIDWKYGVGGGGAIDLVMHLRDCRFADALAWLERHFPAPLGTGFIPTAPSVPPTRRPSTLPPPAPSQLWRVQRYLRCQRRIPPALIDSLIASGQLYADHRANAVFVLRDHRNSPVGAELRGTTRRCWRGLAAGSQKDRGYFAIGNDRFQTTILCESAIDAISCFALYSGQCISTSGARSNPPWLAALLEQGQSVFCGFDADPTGDRMAQALIERYPSVRRLRPPLHDWNDTLCS